MDEIRIYFLNTGGRVHGDIVLFAMPFEKCVQKVELMLKLFVLWFFFLQHRFFEFIYKIAFR